MLEDPFDFEPDPPSVPTSTESSSSQRGPREVRRKPDSPPACRSSRTGRCAGGSQRGRIGQPGVPRRLLAMSRRAAHDRPIVLQAAQRERGLEPHHRVGIVRECQKRVVRSSTRAFSKPPPRRRTLLARGVRGSVAAKAPTTSSSMRRAEARRASERVRNSAEQAVQSVGRETFLETRNGTAILALDQEPLCSLAPPGWRCIREESRPGRRSSPRRAWGCRRRRPTLLERARRAAPGRLFRSSDPGAAWSAPGSRQDVRSSRMVHVDDEQCAVERVGEAKFTGRNQLSVERPGARGRCSVRFCKVNGRRSS